MRIPDVIQKSHILKAIQAIRHRDVPVRRKAKKYHLLFKGHRYPAKYALSLAYTFTSPGRAELRFEGGQQTNAFLQSRGFTIIDSRGKTVDRIPPKTHRESSTTKASHSNTKARGSVVPTDKTAFWIVSPNVSNKDQTVLKWRQASIIYKAAFMGYHPADRGHKQIGYKFAYAIHPGDVILIARRHRGNIEVAGFGVVTGKSQRRIKGMVVPQAFGSLRKLSPFVAISLAPRSVPLMAALRHTMALRQLRPERSTTERLVCEWMKRSLKQTVTQKSRQPRVDPKLEVLLANLIQNHQLEYQVRKRKTIAQAKKAEAVLLDGYIKWLGNQGRRLHTVKYKSLRCDAYEKQRNNLIEAKSTVRREHLRMAVGELLDYSYLGRRHLRNPKMAILLPAKPDSDVEMWLSGLHINIIWKQRASFLDNANGQFT